MQYPYSLAGRVIQNRSTPWYDKRIRSEPIYYREQQLPMDHTMAPPGVVANYYGRPLTKAEQSQKHYGRMGAPIGPSGHAVQLGAGVQRLAIDWGAVFGGVILGVVFGYFIFSASGRKIGYKAGKRVSRRL